MAIWELVAPIFVFITVLFNMGILSCSTDLSFAKQAFETGISPALMVLPDPEGFLPSS